MEVSQSSNLTLPEPGETYSSKLRLDDFPPIFVLEAHLEDEKLRRLEDILHRAGAPLTYDLKEASIALGAVEKQTRARFELKRADVRFNQLRTKRSRSSSSTASINADPEIKRRRPFHHELVSEKKTKSLDARSSSSESDQANDSDTASKTLSQLSLSALPTSLTSCSSSEHKLMNAQSAIHNPQDLSRVLKFVNIRWLISSLENGKPAPLDPYTVLTVETAPAARDTGSSEPREVYSRTLRKGSTSPSRTERGSSTVIGKILERAQADPKSKFPRFLRRDRIKDEVEKDFAGRSFAPSGRSRHQSSRPIHLLHETTSEHDEVDNAPLPQMPKWVTDQVIYSCQRRTPMISPNDDFIALLQKIKKARLLMADDIGVRAYSTSIAALAAYPRVLVSPREVLALPGCDSKIAALFTEYRESGNVHAAVDIDNDPVLKILGLFYGIWGVGATTAREFYYQNHWRDLDDIVINGWRSLNRVQQIGLKYYDDFLLPIPRIEVEAIAEIVHSHAKVITDDDLQCIIVGGYRRGKPTSGDVDIILSHPNEAVTLGFINDIVDALEESGRITHTLTKALTNTNRGQQPLDLRPGGSGHGFDTLDKALVVWQNQYWPNKEHDIAAIEVENEQEIQRAKVEDREPKQVKVKNLNPHRRVDIIISPWKTVGCAVAGWTSGTTFQRDLRRYAKKVKGWKFDSSGVRDRATGKWIDLEEWRDPRTRCTTWQEAERRVFLNMGLEYFEPWERCTG